MRHDDTTLTDLVSERAAHASSSTALTIDYDKYLAALEEWDVSEEEKQEFIDALWNLLLTFAELGYDIHPVQRVQSASKIPSEESSKT